MNDIIGKYGVHNARTDNKGEAELVELWLDFIITTKALEYLKG